MEQAQTFTVEAGKDVLSGHQQIVYSIKIAIITHIKVATMEDGMKFSAEWLRSIKCK